MQHLHLPRREEVFESLPCRFAGGRARKCACGRAFSTHAHSRAADQTQNSSPHCCYDCIGRRHGSVTFAPNNAQGCLTQRSMKMLHDMLHHAARCFMLYTCPTTHTPEHAKFASCIAYFHARKCSRVHVCTDVSVWMLLGNTWNTRGRHGRGLNSDVHVYPLSPGLQVYRRLCTCECLQLHTYAFISQVPTVHHACMHSPYVLVCRVELLGTRISPFFTARAHLFLFSTSPFSPTAHAPSPFAVPLLSTQTVRSP